MRRYRNYTDEDIRDAAIATTSMAQCLRRLGLKPTGGNYANMKRNLQRLDISAIHWKGQAWNKGERLKDWSEYTRVARIKPHLIEKRGHRCENCNYEMWMELPITLEVHHKDGERTNNEYDNLLLVCPNCHALTVNWRKPHVERAET